MRYPILARFTPPRLLDVPFRPIEPWPRFVGIRFSDSELQLEFNDGSRAEFVGPAANDVMEGVGPWLHAWPADDLDDPVQHAAHVSYPERCPCPIDFDFRAQMFEAEGARRWQANAAFGVPIPVGREREAAELLGAAPDVLATYLGEPIVDHGPAETDEAEESSTEFFQRVMGT